MKILQVGTGFASMPPAGAYGTERTIHCLSAAMTALGHDVTVIDIEEKNRPPIPYQVVEVPLRWRKDVNLPTHILRGFAFRQASRQGLRTLLQKEHFDIINFNNQFSASHISLARSHTIPVVYSLHNALWYNVWACRSSWQRLKFFQDIRAMKTADIVICLNKTTSFNLTRYFSIAPIKIAVTPNGINEKWLVEREVPEDLRNRYAPNNEYVILHVGRIAPYKNQLTLVFAIPPVIKEIPKVRFLFIGPVTDKHYYHRLQSAITGLGVDNYVSFLGEIPYDELPHFYSLCTVFVCPSSSEAMPTVILEAMAQSKAIVTSDIEPFSDALPRGVGTTVPTFDHQTLAHVISNMIKDASLREKMGQRAKEHVRRNYTWDNVAKRTAQVYEDVLKW